MKLKNWAGPTALAVLVAAIVSGAVWVAHGHGSGAAASAGRPHVLHLASSGGRSSANTLAASSADSASGGSRYVLSGSLPDGQPDDQAAWRTPQPTAADAADIADALGLTGTPQRADGGWVLRDADNRLVVRDDGGWSYGMDCAPDTPVSDQELTVGCAYAYASSGGVAVAEPPADDANSSGGGSSDGSTGSGGGDPGTAPDCDPAADGCGMTIEPDPGTSPEPVPTYSPGPSDGDARGYAAPILNALGIGDADLAVYTGSPITTVQASPRVDGMVTSGWWTDLQFDGDGKLSSGNGWVSRLIRGDSYPVITAQAAFDQLESQPQPMMEMCMVRKDGKPGCADFPPTEITGAKLGLILDYEGQRPTLVPAWLFDVKDQPEAIAQIAVDPKFLAPPPEPSADPGGDIKPMPPVEASPVPAQTEPAQTKPAETKPMPADSAPPNAGSPATG